MPEYFCPKCDSTEPPRSDGPGMGLFCPTCKLVLPAPPRRGRPPTPEPLKRVDVPLRLPRWLAEWVRDNGPASDVIEDALISRHKLRPPKT
jgi:hypothetical protein